MKNCSVKSLSSIRASYLNTPLQILDFRKQSGCRHKRKTHALEAVGGASTDILYFPYSRTRQKREGGGRNGGMDEGPGMGALGQV